MQSTVPMPQSTPIEINGVRRSWDVHLWLVLAVAAAVLLPRSFLITLAQSERADDEYHVARGLILLTDRSRLPNVRMNDPPLGQAIEILPLYLAGTSHAGPPNFKSFFWGHKYSANTILHVIGLWKSLLLLPMIGVVFVWARELYGLRAAWIAVILLLIEPTIAAHTPLPSLDVMGVEAIVIASFLGWRYFEKPTWPRLIVSAFAMGTALLIKHTAVVVPIVGGCFAFLWWIIKPLRDGGAAQLHEEWNRLWKYRLAATATSIAVMIFSIYALLGFDYRRPLLSAGFVKEHPIASKILNHKLPGGLYVTSFLQGMGHAERGHWAFLNGEIKRTGWWYYFPVVATYKVPIGIGLFILAGLISLKWLRLKWDEWAMLVPLILLAVLMLTSKVNIGWRHFLPAYALTIVVASRWSATAISPRWMIACSVLIGFIGVDTLRYHPDYLSYSSFVRKDAWRSISDSNIDWGQSLKQIRAWISKHPQSQPVSIRCYSWRPTMEYVKQRLAGKKVTIMGSPAKLPTEGTLIVSAVSMVGLQEAKQGSYDPFKKLRDIKPHAVIGHSMFVYNLDLLRDKDKPFDWGPQPKFSKAQMDTAAGRPVRRAPARPTTRAAVKPATRPTTQSAK